MDNYAFYMSTNLEKYVGEWIAVIDGNVIAHSNSAKEAYQAARKLYPGKTPFLTCVPKHAAMIL